MSQTFTLSCVIPGLNESENLQVLLPSLLDELKALNVNFEIIVVDDGSTDGTAALLHRFCQKSPELVYLQLSRNFGKEAALSAGLARARGNVVVTMDADLQHPPQLIAQMLKRWHDGVEMVYAVRETRDDESWLKRWGTRLFYRLMRLSGNFQMPEDAGDFRLMDRCVVDALMLLPERNRFMKGLFAWVGFRAEPIIYKPEQRLHGKSSFKPLRLLHFAIDGLTAFTTWPLRLVSLIGVSVSFLSFLYGVFIILKYAAYGDPVQGWASLITVVLFFSGINLLSIGILGEYIGRIFGEVKNRPLYLVRNQLGRGLAENTNLRAQPQVLPNKGPETTQDEGEKSNNN